jgi:ABC-type uncharacterized transport system involved in gliding motility auxiliary subunit
METLLALLGLVFAVFGLIGLFAGAPGGLIWLQLVLGIGLLVYAGIRRVGRLNELVRGAGGRHSSNVVVQTAALCAIAGLFAFISARNPVNWDWTEAGLYTLSEATVDVLGSIADEDFIEVYGFFSDHGEEIALPGQENAAKTLLDMYTYETDRVRVSYFDPIERPALAERFEVRSDRGILLVCSGPCEQASSPVRVAQFAEAEFTKAIRSVLTEERKIYMLAGHGEAALDEDEATGFSQMKRLLENENYALSELVLAGDPVVPEDADAVLVVGPDHSLFSGELQALDRYLRGGGALAILADPFVISGLEEQVRTWGIELGNDIVIAEQQSLFTGPQLGVQPLVADYGSHPITEKMGPRTVTVFSRARSLRGVDGADPAPTELVLTQAAPQSWAETDTERFLSERAVAYDESADRGGPVAIAMATSVSGDDGKQGRLFVAGDSDFARNRFIAEVYNADLFLNAVNWLVGQEEFATIDRKRPRASTAEITWEQFATFRYLSLFLLPELILLLGIVVWWRRRV